MRGVSYAFGGFGAVESLFESRDGVFGGDLWFFGFGAEEGVDVEAGEGFYFVAGAFARLGFGGNWGLLGFGEIWGRG